MGRRLGLQTWHRARRWIIPCTKTLAFFYPLFSTTATDTTTKNVHEGPMGIGTRREYSEVALAAGNVLSDGNYPPSPSLKLKLNISLRTWLLRGRQIRNPYRKFVLCAPTIYPLLLPPTI